jgi:dTDP-glucose 4,6-dehydratase
MRILVTGGLGAIGAPLVRELRARGREVWVCDLLHSEGPNYIRCDVGSFRQVEAMFDTQEFDVVYHLAAEFGRLNGEDYYDTLWRTNAIGTKNILRMQEQEHHRFRMIFASSSEVYGDWEGVLHEDVPHTHPIRQMNDYAISKWVNELQIINSAERFGTESVRVRLFNTYGPGEHYSPYRSVICQFVYCALHDLPYTVYLGHKRTSSYIDDTVNTLANIADTFHAGEVYNICGDEYHDIKSLSDMILDYLGKPNHPVGYVDYEAHNTRNKQGNNTKAKRDLDHRCTVPLSVGIPRTIEWQKEVYKRG